jgi:hypothetical protein
MWAEVAYQFCMLPTGVKILVAGGITFQFAVAAGCAFFFWRP